jgi:hypothetical protein
LYEQRELAFQRLPSEVNNTEPWKFGLERPPKAREKGHLPLQGSCRVLTRMQWQKILDDQISRRSESKSTTLQHAAHHAGGRKSNKSG